MNLPRDVAVANLSSLKEVHKLGRDAAAVEAHSKQLAEKVRVADQNNRRVARCLRTIKGVHPHVFMSDTQMQF